MKEEIIPKAQLPEEPPTFKTRLFEAWWVVRFLAVIGYLTYYLFQYVGKPLWWFALSDFRTKLIAVASLLGVCIVVAPAIWLIARLEKSRVPAWVGGIIVFLVLIPVTCLLLPFFALWEGFR